MLQNETLFLLKKEACAGALEGSFIKMLTQLTKATTVVEVGMFTGTTTLAVAAALPKNGKVAFTQPGPLAYEQRIANCLQACILAGCAK